MILTSNKEEDLECIVDSKNIVRHRNLKNKRFARGYLYKLKQLTIYRIKPATRQTGVSIDFHIDLFELMLTKGYRYPNLHDSEEVQDFFLRAIQDFVAEYVGYGVDVTTGVDFPEPTEWNCGRKIVYDITRIKKAKITFWDGRGSRAFSVLTQLEKHLMTWLI